MSFINVTPVKLLRTAFFFNIAYLDDEVHNIYASRVLGIFEERPGLGNKTKNKLAKIIKRDYVYMGRTGLTKVAYDLYYAVPFLYPQHLASLDEITSNLIEDRYEFD